MASAQARFDETLARIDSVLDRSVRRVEAIEERQDAEREDARRQRQRNNAEQRREMQATYADAFQSFGTEVPMPVDDEAPSRYRARLFNRLARRLASGHELADIRADDLGGSPVVFDNLEKMLLDAAKAEGERPSLDNLPSDGSLISRTRVDSDTNEKQIHWYGKRSFIADLGRPGRPVERIVDRKTGNAIWGRPFSQAR
jgi:hypothetical protein